MAIPIPIPTRPSPGACFARPGAIGSDPSRIPFGAKAWALVRHHWDKAITNGDEDIASPFKIHGRGGDVLVAPAHVD